jgi:hypothetical protein
MPLPRSGFAVQYTRARDGVFRKGTAMKKLRCEATTRRGTPCQAAAIWSTKSKRYTRCKNHGGMSTGPKTADGLERIRQAVTKHGRYSRQQEPRTPAASFWLVDREKGLNVIDALSSPFRVNKLPGVCAAQARRCSSGDVSRARPPQRSFTTAAGSKCRKSFSFSLHTYSRISVFSSR